MEIKIVEIQKKEEMNVIVGQSHFIKTVEDIHEALVNSVPGIQFGLAFCEASGPRLVRFSGNNEKLISLVKENAFNIGAGHVFVLLIDKAYPINILNAIKNIPEVCTIFAATANPLKVIVLEEGNSRGVIGVIDGEKPLGYETEHEINERKGLLRKFGYKL